MRAAPFNPEAFFLIAPVDHLKTGLTDGNPIFVNFKRRIIFKIPGVSFIEVYEGFNIPVFQELIGGVIIMSAVKDNLVDVKLRI